MRGGRGRERERERERETEGRKEEGCQRGEERKVMVDGESCFLPPLSVLLFLPVLFF